MPPRRLAKVRPSSRTMREVLRPTRRVEVDTQSAGFSILTITLHHAYPRAEGSWERQKCARDTHRRTHNARNHAATPALFSAQASQASKRAARRRKSRQRRAGGAPVPPDDSCRAAAPPQLPGSPPCTLQLYATAQRPAAPRVERDQHERGDDRAADRRGDARDLGADDGDDAGWPRGSVQQQVKRRAAVSGLQVQAGTCGRRHPHPPSRCPQRAMSCTSPKPAADAGEDALPPVASRLSVSPCSAPTSA